MKRRDFIKSLGVAGVISILPCGTSKALSEKKETTSSQFFGQVQSDIPKSPFSLAFDSTGGLLVTDPSLYRVWRLDDTMTVSNSFGRPGATPGSFNYPKGIATDSNNFIYVVDSNNCRVQVFDISGRLIKTVGAIGSIGGLFATPQGICIDRKNNMLVADTRNHRIQIFESFQLVSIIGELGDGNDQFRLPTACQTTPDGEILALDSKHGLIKIFDKNGNFKRSFAGEGSSPGSLNTPQGMALDSEGSIFVADTGNHRIQKFDFSGKLVSIWASDSSGVPLFKTPTGLAVKDGSVYVADTGKGAIIKLAAAN